jgi:hypothetical protein
MTTITEIVRRLESCCPTRLVALDWEDPILVLTAEAFRITCTCSWRVVDGERMVAGWEDAQVPGLLHSLVSESVVGVTLQARNAPLDPAFKLSSGRIIELFSAGALEPWVLRVTGSPTFVASPTDPEQWGSTGPDSRNSD